MDTLLLQLEATYKNIQATRMEGVPVINEKLQVKAIGFQSWNTYHLGILITPWFMNLMLIPSEISDNTRETFKTGSTHQHVFPSGAYEFVAGFEQAIGHYQSCSLFSPMFEFEDQETAELTALEVLKAIMSKENFDKASQNPANDIEKIWKGEKPQPARTHDFDGAKIEIANKPPRKELSERLKEPTSRRDFLRSKIFQEEVSTEMPKKEANL